VLLLPPSIYRANDAEVVEHYRRVAEVGLPIMAYNNPFDTKVDLTPQLLKKIAKIPEVVAVKEFSGDVRRVFEIREATGLDVIAGADDLLFETLVDGAVGWFAGYPNAFPKEAVEIYDLVQAGDLAAARELYRNLVAVFRWDSRTEFVQFSVSARTFASFSVLSGSRGGLVRPPKLWPAMSIDNLMAPSPGWPTGTAVITTCIRPGRRSVEPAHRAALPWAAPPGRSGSIARIVRRGRGRARTRHRSAPGQTPGRGAARPGRPRRRRVLCHPRPPARRRGRRVGHPRTARASSCDPMHYAQPLEYLWGAVWCFFAEGDPAAQTWVHERTLAVLYGNARGVAAGIRRRATATRSSKPKRLKADACAKYLTNKADYLDYPTALAAGWPVASGVIEGTCRYLVADRMDITGARWSVNGAEAVLKLRAVRANDDFDEYWNFHLNNERHRTHQTRYAAETVPGPRKGRLLAGQEVREGSFCVSCVVA